MDCTVVDEALADPVGIGTDEIGGRYSKHNLAFLYNGYTEVIDENGSRMSNTLSARVAMMPVPQPSRRASSMPLTSIPRSFAHFMNSICLGWSESLQGGFSSMMGSLILGIP